MKNNRVFFLSENFQFLEVKFSIYLNRRVFVMGINLQIRVPTLFDLSPFSPAGLSKLLANSVEPNKTAHDKPPHQDLHRLPFCFDF